MDRHDLTVRFFLPALALISLSPGGAQASHICLTPQPAFSYVDVDNDGCYTDGVDSGSIDAALQAAPPMAGMPSYTDPADTGIVVPRLLVLPVDADPYWSVPNDVWIDGKITGPSSLRIEAGGTTNIHGSIRLKAQGFSNEGDLRLGCISGCGPTIIADEVELANNGLLAIYDGEAGNGVRIRVSCSPGGVPSCGGRAYFGRAVSIGDDFQLKSPGGITFDDGALPLTIGNNASLQTKAVRTDGGTLGFSIRFELPAGATIGNDVRMRSGGSTTIEGRVDSDPVTGPISIGTGASFVGSTVLLHGAGLEIGADARLKGKPDISIPGHLSTVSLHSPGGALVLGDELEIDAGRVFVNAATNDLVIGTAADLATASASQAIELTGGHIAVGPGSSLTKSTGDSTPIQIEALLGVDIEAVSFQGAGLVVTLSNGTITFTDNDATGAEGTTARFEVLGGLCDLTGSTFTKMSLDTSGCGSVVGP
jgi:hypothetical protein